MSDFLHVRLAAWGGGCEYYTYETLAFIVILSVNSYYVVNNRNEDNIMAKYQIEDIERIFRLLGLDSDSERERILDLSKTPESRGESSYRVYTTGDTNAIQEDKNAKLERNSQ